MWLCAPNGMRAMPLLCRTEPDWPDGQITQGTKNSELPIAPPRTRSPCANSHNFLNCALTESSSLYERPAASQFVHNRGRESDRSASGEVSGLCGRVRSRLLG